MYIVFGIDGQVNVISYTISRYRGALNMIKVQRIILNEFTFYNPYFVYFLFYIYLFLDQKVYIINKSNLSFSHFLIN